MNSKKISVILIAIAFFIIAVFCAIGITTVKDVNVTFAISENTDASAVQRALDKSIGKNLFLLSEEEVRQSLADNHYMEILSVEKQFPNVVNVSVRERREIYYIEYENNVYVTDETGFVLKQGQPSGNLREKIKLSLGTGIELTSLNPGSIIKTDNDDLLALVFDVAKKVNLTDCIESILIERSFGEVDEYDVVFKAYTGVELRVLKVMTQGEEKVTNAFKAYNEKLTDYQKISGEIMSFLMDDGRLRVNYNDGKHVIPVM